MREIKFRAWEISLREIIPVNNIHFNKKMINTNGAWRLFDEIVLMQYTGLTDTNGVDIYEGDIVEAGIGEIENFEIRFVKGRFTMKAVESDENSLWILDEKCKIIGNIYENPELLEVSTE